MNFFRHLWKKVATTTAANVNLNFFISIKLSWVELVQKVIYLVFSLLRLMLLLITERWNNKKEKEKEHANLFTTFWFCFYCNSSSFVFFASKISFFYFFIVVSLLSSSFYCLLKRMQTLHTLFVELVVTLVYVFSFPFLLDFQFFSFKDLWYKIRTMMH